MNDRRRIVSLVVLSLTLSLAYGIWYAYSVAMVALLAEFGWSRSLVAGAFSVFILVHGVVNPPVGWLCGRVDPPRIVAAGGVIAAAGLWMVGGVTTPLELYLGFGVLTAIGVCACGWVPAVVQVRRRFPDRLGLALGIVSAGVGLGMVLVVPLFQVLIDTRGWRFAFRALGAVCFVWVVAAAVYLMRTPPPARASGSASSAGGSATSARAAETSLAEALRRRSFWLIMAAFFFGAVCAQTMHVHQVAYLVDHGVATMVAASMVGVVGAASIVGKIGSGWLSDSFDRELVFVAGIVVMILSVGALVTVGASRGGWGAYLYASMLGLGYSVTAALLPAMAADRFGGPQFGAIIGVGLLGSATGGALGPWLAGWLFDVSGSYALPLAIAVVCGVLCAGAGGALWWGRRRGVVAGG